MSNLKNDPNRDHKLKTLYERLVRTLCKEQNLAMDIEKISNINVLIKALEDFDNLYHDYLDICPLGSTNANTLQAYQQQNDLLLKLFLPFISLEKPNKYLDTYTLNWRAQEAKHRWKQWVDSQPINRPVREAYDIAHNRGIIEKFLRSELGLQEWLSDPDIKRVLAALDILDEVHVTRFTAQDIGIILHHERETHLDQQEYQIPLIVNLGIDQYSYHRDQGIHWARMIVTVKPQTQEIIVKYNDSLKLSIKEQQIIRLEIQKALQYKETSKENNAVKTYSAFPDYKITIECKGSGEQQDGWTCGYRAVKGIAEDLGIEHPLVHCDNTQKLRDCVYHTILKNAEFQKNDLHNISYATQTTLFKETNDTCVLKENVIAGYLLQLKKSDSKNGARSTSINEEELKNLLIFEKLVKNISQLEHIKALTPHSHLIYLDLKSILDDTMKQFPVTEANAEIYQAALLKSIFDQVSKFKTATTWKIVNFAAISEKNREFFLTELDKSPYFVHIDCGDLNVAENQHLSKTANIIAARNKLIAMYDLDIEENADCWDTLIAAYIADVPQNSNAMRALQFYKQVMSGSAKEHMPAAIHTMGVVWYEKLYKYIRENRAKYIDTPFPFSKFEINLNCATVFHLSQNIEAAYIETLIKEIQTPNNYIPFNLIYFEGDTFTPEAFEALKKLIPLLPQTTIERIYFQPNKPELSSAQVDELIELAKKHKITTLISVGQGGPHNRNKLENTIYRNLREKAKEKRLEKIGLKETAAQDTHSAAPSPQVTPQVVSKPGKVRPYKIDHSLALKSIGTEVQHQVQQLQQHQVTQQQQRQQQIDQQQQRQKTDGSPLGETSSQNLLDRSHIEPYEPYFQGMLFSGTADIFDFWDRVIGINSQHLRHNIQKVTPEAFHMLIKYYYLFAGGLVQDDLPKGFFLQKTDADETVLCFDRVKYIENKNFSPLTLEYTTKIFPAPNFGDLGQFLPEDAAIPRDPIRSDTLIKKYMFQEDPIFAEKIAKEFKDITDEFSPDDWSKLSNIFFAEGCVGLYALFQSFRKIKNCDNGETYKQFKQNFFELFDNPMELLLDESRITMDKIAALDERKLAWWNALTTQHCDKKVCPHPNLRDLFNAFEHFCNALEKIDPNIKLPLPCPLTGIRNMKVSLKRLLFILNNAIDVREQLYHLDGLVLDNECEYYAARYEDFYLVTKEMQLSPNVLHINQGKGDFFYRVQYQDLTNPIYAYESTKILFYRYLGHIDTEPYLAPYQNYLTLMQNLDNLSLDEDIKKRLIPILASGTTGMRAYQMNFAAVSKNLFNLIEQLCLVAEEDNKVAKKSKRKAPKQNENLEKIKLILDELTEWHDVKPRINLIELTDFIHLLKDFDKKDISGIAKRLKDHISEEFLTAIKHRAQNKNPLPLLEYLDLLDKLKQTIKDDKVSAKLAIILAHIDNKNLNNQDKENFITELHNLLAKNPDKIAIQHILDILCSLDLEKSAKLPSLSEINHLLNQVQQLGNLYYNSIYQFFAKNLPACTFNTNNNNFAIKINLDELIQKNLENIIEFVKKNNIPGIKIAKLRGEGAANYLINLIKKYDEHVPELLKEQIKAVFRAQHEADLVAYAKSRLENFSTEICSLIVKKINDDLFTQKLPLMHIISNIEIRTTQMQILIDLLAKISAKWPEATKNLLDVLNNGIYIHHLPIDTLYRIIHIISENSKEQRFNPTIIKIILDNPLLATLNAKDIVLLEEIEFKITTNHSVSSAQKEKVLKLALYYLAKKGNNPVKFTEDLLQYKNDAIYNILVAKGISLEKLLRKKTAVDQYLAIFSQLNEKNPHIQSKFFNFMLTRPHSFLCIAEDIQHISKEKRAAILKITMTAAQAEKIFNLAITRRLIASLKTQSTETLNALAELYNAKPFPLLETLFAIGKPGFELNAFINEFEKDPFLTRSDALEIQRQFSDANVSTIIDSMEDLTHNRKLLHPEKLKLLDWFHYVNMIGNTHPIKVNPNDPLNSKLSPVKDLSREEITSLIKHYKAFIQDKNKTDEEKNRARLENLALIREVMYRTTGIMSHSTQILSVLNALRTGGDLLAEIKTGEGKGVTSALFAAMLWMEGQAVDVCTSNTALAQRDLIKFSPFYHYLGANSTLISADSNPKTYCVNGINYSDVAQLSLFQERAKLEGYGKLVSGKASLVLDEADFTLLDDSTQYRYAVSLDASISPYLNLYEWLYPMINDFVDTDLFNDPRVSAEQDVINARRYLLHHAKTMSQKERINEISDKMLSNWLDSAFSASQLHEDVHYVVQEEVREINHEKRKISMARLLINDWVSQDAQYSNGVQQFLHARLNTKIPEKSTQAKFPIDPEKAHVASTSSKNFVDQYRKKDKRGGRVWCMTGTSGSDKERQEQEAKYGISMFRMPPHRPSKLRDKNLKKPILTRNAREHQEKITENTIHRLRKDAPPPVLILCKNIPTTVKLHQFLKVKLKKQSRKYVLQMYNGVDFQTSLTDNNTFKNECVLFLEPTQLTRENLRNLQIKSNRAYIRSGDKLFYIDKVKQEYLELDLNKITLEKFDAQMKPKKKRRILSEEQLQEIQSIIGSPHQETQQDIQEMNWNFVENDAADVDDKETECQEKIEIPSLIEQVIHQAGMSGTITIATAILARGTDIKPRIEKAAAYFGGLTTMVTYPDSERGTRQGSGRSARQAEEGEAILIINAEDLAEFFDETNSITEENLQDALGKWREKHNSESTHQRQYRERYSDVTNHVFEKLLFIADAINESDCKNKTPLRQQILRHWELYLSNLDKKWNEIAFESDSPAIEECIAQLIQYACTHWDNFITLASPILEENAIAVPPNLKLDKDFIHQDIFATFVKKPHDSVPEETCSLLPSNEIDRDTIYLRMVPEASAGYKAEGIEIAKRPVIFQLSQVFNDMKDHYFKNKLFGTLTHENYLVKTREMFDAIFQEHYAVFDPSHKRPMSEHHLRVYYNQLTSIIKLGDLAELHDIAFDAHRIEFLSKIYSLDLHSESYLHLISHNLIDAQRQKIFGKNKVDDIKKDLLSTTRATILRWLGDYKKSFSVAKDRKGNVEELITKLNNSTTIDEAMIALNTARSLAIQSDLDANKSFLFSTRNTHGSRYQEILTKIRDRCIASCDSSTLDKLVAYEIDDMRNIMKKFFVHAVRNNSSADELISYYCQLDARSLMNKPVDEDYILHVFKQYKVILELELYIKSHASPVGKDVTTQNFMKLMSEKCNKITKFLQQSNLLNQVLTDRDFSARNKQSIESSLEKAASNESRHSNFSRGSATLFARSSKMSQTPRMSIGPEEKSTNTMPEMIAPSLVEVKA